jgi:hypothetical protein
MSKKTNVTACLCATILLFLPGSLSADLVGLWRFEDPNNVGAASIGSDLDFKSTGIGWVAGSGGSDTGAARVGFDQALIMTNPIGGNGGGARTNEYTVVMDVFRFENTFDFQAVMQTRLTNGFEADLFFRADDGIGISGNYGGLFEIQQWMRLALVFDMNEAVGQRLRVYKDGLLERSVSPVQTIDGRWSAGEQIWFFSDGTEDPNAGGEEGVHFVSNLALFSRALTGEQVLALGGVGSAIPEPTTCTLLLAGMSALHLLRRRA